MTQLDPNEKQWLGVKVADGSMHVFPSNDLVDHLPTEDCICGPSFDPVPRPDGTIGTLYSHHSMDGCEFSEKTA
jgi:hypothetical protein